MKLLGVSLKIIKGLGYFKGIKKSQCEPKILVK